MLVLSRREGESIVIGGDVRVSIVSISGNQVKLSIEAPRSVSIHRSEVWEAIKAENELAMRGGMAAGQGEVRKDSLEEFKGKSIEGLVAGGKGMAPGDAEPE